MLASGGAFVVRTGPFTGRSPKDKYIVRDSSTENTIDWGAVNQPLSQKQFDELFGRMATHWQGQDVFVQDLFGGAICRNESAGRAALRARPTQILHIAAQIQSAGGL